MGQKKFLSINKIQKLDKNLILKITSLFLHQLVYKTMFKPRQQGKIGFVLNEK